MMATGAPHGLLRSLLTTIASDDRTETIAYVALSVAVAVAGSAAAVLLVPLVAPGSALGRPVRYVLSNSFAFGGSNASLLFARP